MDRKTNWEWYKTDPANERAHKGKNAQEAIELLRSFGNNVFVYEAIDKKLFETFILLHAERTRKRKAKKKR